MRFVAWGYFWLLLIGLGVALANCLSGCTAPQARATDGHWSFTVHCSPVSKTVTCKEEPVLRYTRSSGVWECRGTDGHLYSLPVSACYVEGVWVRP